MDRRRLIKVALGRAPADCIVRGGRIVDVHTGEIRPADIAVAAGRIAYVGAIPAAAEGPRTEVIDASGYFVAPD